MTHSFFITSQIKGQSPMCFEYSNENEFIAEFQRLALVRLPIQEAIEAAFVFGKRMSYAYNSNEIRRGGHGEASFVFHTDSDSCVVCMATYDANQLEIDCNKANALELCKRHFE